MKKLQQLCMAGVFTLVLTTTTFAGDIQTPGFTQPPPRLRMNRRQQRSGTFTPGEYRTRKRSSDSVADIALNLLQTMLSVF